MSGVRGVFVRASGLPASVTDKKQLAHQNHRGSVSSEQAQALIEALILYAHERLQLGQRAEDIFAYVFAKQQTVMVR